MHGNEASSAEAALQTAYRMAAAEDEETSQFRNEAVTIIDPVLNPDGRDRYVTWYKSSRANMLNTDPVDLEHDEIWPGGRTNHYWFDLNRDWVWLVHPESRGRIAEYQKWMPQVHLDLHEQGFNSNYFTMPGTTPGTNSCLMHTKSGLTVLGEEPLRSSTSTKSITQLVRRSISFTRGMGRLTQA